jgi:ATP-dependent DNA helicase PIF1
MKNSIEQDYAIDLFLAGKNIALMGPAGTGKTTLVAKFKELALKNNKTIAVTALTGCASLLLGSGARTLSSWSGLNVPKGTHAAVVDRFYKNEKKYSVWEKTDILLIDEVSMLSQYLFDILDDVAKSIRNSTLPFGGMQIICIGDFHQLPPILSTGELNSGNYCFESRHWKSTFPEESHVVLKTIFRQSDPLFQSVLTGIRNEKLEPEHKAALNQCLGKVYKKEEHSGCSLPKIMPLKSQCDKINEDMFSTIHEPSYEYHLDERTDFKTWVETTIPLPEEIVMKCCRINTKTTEQEIKNLRASSSFPETIHLKKGACVMCTTNLDLDHGICNGSIGTVEKCDNTGVIVKFSNGRVVTITKKYWQSEDYPTIVVGQIPLMLAWAITIHKSQGATLPMAEINIGNSIFAPGQVYVAVSRVKSLEGLYLTEFNPSKIKVNPKVKEFYKNAPEFDFGYESEEEEEEEEEEISANDIKLIHYAYKP